MPSQSECEKARSTLQKCKRVMPVEVGKCFRTGKGTEVDSGSFDGERLAKTGDQLVTMAIDDVGGKQSIAPEDKRTTKTNYCEVKSGTQLTTSNDVMGLRLCDGKTGYIAEVTSAIAAKAIGDDFISCKGSQDAKKCALKLGAKPEVR